LRRGKQGQFELLKFGPGNSAKERDDPYCRRRTNTELMSKERKPALGKGLSALLKDATTDITSSGVAPVGGISHIKLNDIQANPFQPRTEFDQTALEELAESIKVHGLIQPITVRKL